MDAFYALEYISGWCILDTELQCVALFKQNVTMDIIWGISRDISE